MAMRASGWGSPSGFGRHFQDGVIPSRRRGIFRDARKVPHFVRDDSILTANGLFITWSAVMWRAPPQKCDLNPLAARAL